MNKPKTVTIEWVDDKNKENKALDMTLWDVYAAAALSGIIANENGPASDWERCAIDSANVATAVIAEREKRGIK